MREILYPRSGEGTKWGKYFVGHLIPPDLELSLASKRVEIFDNKILIKE